MQKSNDIELLRQYAQGGSEQAFAALVSRYIDLVYSVALRHVGNSHHAEEITQAVFLTLAKKAPHLPAKTVLAGWLHQTARFTAANSLRSEIQRTRREQEHMQQYSNEPEPDVWRELAPSLDAALARLSATDRNAVLLRFFEGRQWSEVGVALGLSEPAVKKRVARALEKLRSFFGNRGVQLSVTSLAAAMSSYSVQTAPAGLSATVTAVAAKGGAVSSTAAALAKSALHHMAWAKAAMTMAIGASVVLTGGLVSLVLTHAATAPNGSTRLQVMAIVRTNKWNYSGDDPQLQLLLALGPKALPSLGELVGWRESSLWRQYERCWRMLPRGLRSRLQDPSVRRDMHRNASYIVSAIGPAAIRPLNRELCGALEDEGWQESTFILRSLYWTIPESSRSVAALTNWISDPTRAHLFGNLDGWTIYPRLPQTMPLLIRCLGNPDIARESAIALGNMGTNASPAVSALIEVANRGIAVSMPQTKSKTRYSSPGEPYLMNRCAALEALGKIGSASPDVLTILRHGLLDTNEDVRFAALRSLSTLGCLSGNELAPLLKSFTARRGNKFSQIVEWAGSLEDSGRPALPWLHRLVDEMDTLPEGTSRNAGDFRIAPDIFRLSLELAICRIESNETPRYLPNFLSFIGRQWEPVEFLAHAGSYRRELMPQLERMLIVSNDHRAATAAYIILGFEPQHSGALATLRDRAQTGPLQMRLAAARWLWQRTGETNAVLPLCVKALDPAEPDAGQAAADTLAEMGPAAHSAVPALKAALWHKDRYVRERAGKSLRKISPEEMPEIH